MNWKKTLLFVAGWLAVALGAIGLLLPVVPTTPFVLLAAVCFSYSSPRFYRWLRRAPYFGPYVENYQTRQGVPLKSKVMILAFVWAGVSISAVLIAKPWAVVLLLLVGVGVSVHIALLKTKKAKG